MKLQNCSLYVCWKSDRQKRPYTCENVAWKSENTVPLASKLSNK